MRKRQNLTIALLGMAISMLAQTTLLQPGQKEATQTFEQGQLKVTSVAPNAVRIQYKKADVQQQSLPDEWLYVEAEATDKGRLQIETDAATGLLKVKDGEGKPVFASRGHLLTPDRAQVSFGPAQQQGEEFIYGLGQFQDGFTNLHGLTRRLTQVNTQISIPMLISNRGYGVLWNNYGLTDFNPCDQSIVLTRQEGEGKREVVNVTSTEGGKREVRRQNRFEATLSIKEAGQYALLLDVGQKMARRHNLSIDGQVVISMSNMWLPPTASQIVDLKAGEHHIEAELTAEDKPTLYYKKVEQQTTLRSPIAQAVDYTVFVGTPDEIIATYRQLTGQAPLMPQWALGYIHCRERFHSSDEILQTANRFRQEHLPADVMVQDWQYWGKYGWNAMRFDEQYYPDPKALTDGLHQMNMRLMLSVWSKIDVNSEVGKQMKEQGYYIPGTDWIDFFNPEAAKTYWQNFANRLVPLGIDAWWQDATEPENDDLAGRRVNNGKYAGELVRNVYPLMVNKTVYEGLCEELPQQRPMILTRCAFAGIQRYGSAMWSGDVGNDWETLRRQISAGLGMQAAGIPWWTYDAGGFFRPGNQYTDKAYQERLLRWIETAVYLPLMRVHGYMSNTEPWNYGEEVQRVVAQCLKERYMLLPYIYSEAAGVTFEGSTLMRPLVFDFTTDEEALRQKHEYMFGKALLVSPVTEPDVKEWKTYLPKNQAGWYDFRSNQHYEGGKTITSQIDIAHIPVFVKGGSILPYGPERQYATEKSDTPTEIRIYPGADATFTLYEDDGHTTAYKEGKCSRIILTWNDARKELTIGKRQGSYEGMQAKREFTVVMPNGTRQTVGYKGKACKVRIS